MKSFTQEQMEKSEYYNIYRSCFDEYDTDHDNIINIQKLPELIQALHLSFPPNFYQRVYDEYHLEKLKAINFDQFFQIVEPHNRNTRLWKLLSDAFLVFDNDADGYLTISQLKIAMQSLGDCLTDEEFEEMLNYASPIQQTKDDQLIELIDYKRFVDTLVRNELEANEIDEAPECFYDSFKV